MSRTEQLKDQIRQTLSNIRPVERLTFTQRKAMLELQRGKLIKDANDVFGGPESELSDIIPQESEPEGTEIPPEIGF